MTLRPYQSKAVAETIASLGRRPILVAPTGSGKTTMGVAIAEGRSLLWIAHRRELIKQAAEGLVAAGRKPDIVCASIDAPMGDGRTIVASVQTLARRKIPPADLTIIDEVHHATSLSYQRIVAAAKDLVGLTATPFRLDGIGLRSAGFDHLVVASTPLELMDQGFLVKPEYFVTPKPDLSGVRTRNGDYEVEGLELAMMESKLVGDLKEHWDQLAGGRRTVIFCVTVKHATAVAALFPLSAVLSGETPLREREEILRKFRSGELLVITTVDVISEGFDLPELSVVMMARPTKSLCRHIQMIGRALRPPGPALIFDHAGNYHVHGPIEAEIEYSLDGRVKREKPPPARTCPACYAIIPAGCKKCPACGHVFEIQEREAIKEEAGQLIKISSWSEKRAFWYENKDPILFEQRFGEKPTILLDTAICDPQGNRVHKMRVFEWLLEKTGEPIATCWKAFNAYKRAFGKAPEAWVRERYRASDPLDVRESG